MISKVGGTVAKICPKCGEELNHRGFCANCKISFEVYEKIKLSSKQLYNQGLHLAKVRDLSGAINVLQRSVRFDKTNIDARNLLGLVYFEIGETVLAIQQWVISKNQRSSDNIAGKYLKIIQENQTHLEKLSSAIKKYNQALHHIIQDSEDLAVIQLKKCLSLNPKFIKAYALLALCMIKENQIPRAQKILLKILAIDKNNYIARKYYDAISEEDSTTKVVPTEEESDSRQEAGQPHRRATVLFSSSFHQVIFVLGGAIIGLAVALFLISPSQIKEKDLSISDLQDQLSIQSTELQTKSTALKEETIKREALDGEKVQLTSSLKKAQDIQGETAKVLLALQYSNAKDYVKAADELFFIDATKLEGTEMLKIFNTLKTEVYTIAAEDAFNSGSNSYFNEVYDKAIEQFDFSIKLAPNEKYSDKAFYYRGVAHYYLEQFEEARKDLEYVITNFPNSPRIENANWYLSKL